MPDDSITLVLATPEMVASVVERYDHAPVTKVALLKAIHDKALLPATKDAALAALSAHYAAEDL